MAKDKESVAVAAVASATPLDDEAPAGLTAEGVYGSPQRQEPEKEPQKQDKPKAKAEKAEAKDAHDAEAEEAADAKKQWDEERQGRDQAHANERKALEGQVELMREEVSRLQGHLEAATKIDTTAEDRKKRVEAAGRLEGLMASLDEESDPALIAKALRTMGGLMTEIVAAPTSTSAVDPGQVQQILDRLGQIEQGFQSLSAQTAAQASQANLDLLLKDLDSEFGAQHRNAAVKAARDTLAAKGLSAEYPPTPLETELVLRNAYMAAVAGDKKAGAMPNGKASVLPGDTGAGGSSAPFAQGPPGTLQEVLADKLRKGEVQ